LPGGGRFGRGVELGVRPSAGSGVPHLGLGGGSGQPIWMRRGQIGRNLEGGGSRAPKPPFLSKAD